MTGTPTRPEYLDQAEAEKFRAEAAAEARKAEAEYLKAAAEARKAEAEALEIEHKAAVEGIKRVREEEKRDRELTADHRHHVYLFASPIETGTVQACIDQLDYWDRTEEPTEFDLVFHSPGGSVLSGMALFDHVLALRAKGWKVTCIARGYAASMAAILLQCGDVRVAGPESYLLIHEVSTAAIGKLSELEDEVAFAKKITDRVCRIFSERSKMSAARVRLKMKREWWVDSTEALKLGLVDEIR